MNADTKRAYLDTAPDFSPSPMTKEWERVGERENLFQKNRRGPCKKRLLSPALLHSMEERGSDGHAPGGSVKTRLAKGAAFLIYCHSPG